MDILFTIACLFAIYGVLYLLKNRKNNIKVIKAQHEYFTRLWLWPAGEHTRWEAEVDTSSKLSAGKLGLFAEDNYEVAKSPEPTEHEIAFCMKYLDDLSTLFPIAKQGLKQGWYEWFKEDLPDNWENEFIVDGFSVPTDGNINNNWGITFFSDKAGHYFSVSIEGQTSKLESIDG